MDSRSSRLDVIIALSNDEPAYSLPARAVTLSHLHPKRDTP